jgi:soluble lytic murein transglycosylase-like protein
MRGAVIVVAAGLVGAAMYYAWPEQVVMGEGGGTAGDDESNIFLDAVDTMTSTIIGWPAGSAPYQDAIAYAADSNGVPVSVLAWLLWKESRYNPDIISGAKRSRVGALGIAQFMPATAIDELGSVAAALDPSIAIPGAARYLAKLYGATGTWAQALAAYNWGIGNVQRKGLSVAPPETVDYYTTILTRAGMETTA